MSNSTCISDVACIVLGISELRVEEAAARIQDDPNSREFLVGALAEALEGDLSFELVASIPAAAYYLHDLHQFAEDIITQVLAFQRTH